MLPPEDTAPTTPPAADEPPVPTAAPLPTLRSDNGRVVLTNETLTVDGRTFLLLELEGADVQHVRWLLWFMAGALVLAGFLLGFLQNWLRTMPAALGMTVGALLLAWGQRGTNRLRLHRLGREAQYFALPGELLPWQKLVAETNRRIRRRHDEAAAMAAAILAAQAAAETAISPPESLQ